MSGVRNDRLAIWLAGLTTLTNFLFTLLGVWLVERVGRRKLTLGSIIGGFGAKPSPRLERTAESHSHPSSFFLFVSDRHVLESESAGRRLPAVSAAQSFGHLPPNGPRGRQLHLRQIPVSVQRSAAAAYGRVHPALKKLLKKVTTMKSTPKREVCNIWRF